MIDNFKSVKNGGFKTKCDPSICNGQGNRNGRSKKHYLFKNCPKRIVANYRRLDVQLKEDLEVKKHKFRPKILLNNF